MCSFNKHKLYLVLYTESLCHPKIHVKILTPKVIVLGGAFGVIR